MFSHCDAILLYLKYCRDIQHEMQGRLILYIVKPLEYYKFKFGICLHAREINGAMI